MGRQKPTLPCLLLLIEFCLVLKHCVKLQRVEESSKFQPRDPRVPLPRRASLPPRHQPALLRRLRGGRADLVHPLHGNLSPVGILHLKGVFSLYLNNNNNILLKTSAAAATTTHAAAKKTNESTDYLVVGSPLRLVGKLRPKDSDKEQ